MKRTQHGVALITAILIVALAAIAAAAVLSSANLAIHRTQNLQESELAWWYVDGVEGWVKTILQRDAEVNKYDSMRDVWATPVDFLPVDEGGLRGGVSDLQGRFNINNLAVTDPPRYQKELAVFSRLFALATEGDEYQAHAIADAIRDYVDSNSEPTGSDGAEDSDYLGMDPARRVPNQPMASISELLLVKGMTPVLYARLAPYLCALPKIGTTINVNTASPLLLRALTEHPNAELERFTEERLKTPAENISELFNTRQVFGADDPQELMGTGSEFFELQVEAFIGSGKVQLYSFYYRPGTNGTPLVYGRSTFTE